MFLDCVKSNSVFISENCDKYIHTYMIYPGTVFWTRIFEYLWDGLEPNYDAVTIRFANAKVILFCLESNSNTQNFSHLKVSIYKGWHWYVSCRCYSMAFNGNSYQVILVIWKFHSLQCTERLVSLATEQQWSLHWNWHFGMVSSVCCGFIAIFEKVWFELCEWSIFICSSLLGLT